MHREPPPPTDPITVPLPATCCLGWYFQHTGECPTPERERPCSDCGADCHTGHLYSCSWYFDDTTDQDQPGDVRR